MKAYPLISVITPCYNRADFLEQTIKSVIEQDYVKIEYIVVDGGSTDGSISILKKYQEKHALKFISEPDGGMYDAINKGFEMSSGSILAYINADDMYFPWTFQTVSSMFEKYSEIDLLYSDTLIYYTESDTYEVNILPTFSVWWLRAGGIIPQPTVFFRRKLLNRLRYLKEDVEYLGDCELWLRGIENGLKMKKIHEVLALETNHLNTLRQKHVQIIKNEKAFLISKYNRGLLKSELIRLIMMRAKYVEKEIYYLYLFLLHGLKLRKANHWRFFRRYLLKRTSLFNYLENKILRNNKKVWDVTRLNHG